MITLEQLLRTRALAQERKQIPKIQLQLPEALERRYAKQLLSLVKASQVEIMRLIEPLLPLIAVDDERQDALPIEFEAVIESLRIFFARLAQNTPPEEIARIQAQGIDKHVKRQFARLIALSPELGEAGGLIDFFIQQNTLLIRDLLYRQLQDIRATLTEAAREGLRHEAIAARLADRLRIAQNRAVLIARDQTLKLNGQLVQHRQTSIGITHYIWDSSLDERVRPDHRALHGTRQSWLTPPITNTKTGARNHPGGDILCRCQAIPVIEDFEPGASA